jgi:hypothetical protein
MLQLKDLIYASENLAFAFTREEQQRAALAL